MKKIILLTALLTASIATKSVYGQDLVPIQCPTGIGDNRWGFKDKHTNETVIPCGYQRVWDFSEHVEGLAKVRKNTTPNAVRADLKYGFIDKTGKEVIPLKYDDIHDFSAQFEGLARVKIGNSFGFIDKTGVEVIPVKYANPEFRFSEGLAVVRCGVMFGFIDRSGREVIPCRFSYAENFSKGLARVKLERDDGYIDVAGAFYRGISIRDKERTDKTVAEKRARGEYNTILARIEQANEIEKQRAEESRIREREALQARDRATTFSFFAKNYVESKINDWQKKGEFEPTADWQKRVSETTRITKAAELLKEAEQAYITERSRNFSVGNMTLGTYDPDNETYLIRNSMHGDWLVAVPIREAPVFRDNWSDYAKTPKYVIIDDQLAISEMVFTKSGSKTYRYSNQASLNYTLANIDYNFAPIDINVAGSSQTPRGQQNISTANITVGSLSDVAKNIPVTNVRNDKTFAVIIANENYRRESRVEFAKNDGEVFKEYCIKTLGLPANNVHFVADATLNDIRAEINWLTRIADAFPGEANIIFYYAGHGIPDESSRTSYLLPVDGFGSDVSTGYKLDDLYQILGNLPAKSVTVFMDACFSGAERGGDMLASARGVAIRAQPGRPTGNMVVFSAAQGDETAFPHREKGHGMFTYFLLKKLQETKGDVTLGELGDYITTNVRQQSIIVNKKSQTPMVTPATTMESTWRNRKLR